MIELRHIGIYVKDIEKLTKFYEITFNMTRVCNNQVDSNILLDELLGITNVRIITTKLITQRGKEIGSGDMLELVKILDENPGINVSGPIYNFGIMHLALGVDDINEVCEKVKTNGGQQYTKICCHSNGNKFAFVKDPEGNWIELIQRKSTHI